MNEELWRIIPGTDNKYEASYSGHIQRIYYRKDGSISSKKYLHPTRNCGSLRVCIIKDGKSSAFSLHRLIASAFFSDFNINDPKSRIEHIDNDILNNRVSNLKIVRK